MLDTSVPAGTSESGSAIDECLSVREGHLFMEDCDTVELATRFGTPLYVVSGNQLRRNAQRFVRVFSDRWDGPVNILASIKANHVLALRRILSDEGVGCDTFGASELWAALSCASPRHSSVNGSGKSPELIEQAVATGCRITLDAPGAGPCRRSCSQARHVGSPAPACAPGFVLARQCRLGLQSRGRVHHRDFPPLQGRHPDERGPSVRSTGACMRRSRARRHPCTLRPAQPQP